MATLQLNVCCKVPESAVCLNVDTPNDGWSDTIDKSCAQLKEIERSNQVVSKFKTWKMLKFGAEPVHIMGPVIDFYMLKVWKLYGGYFHDHSADYMDKWVLACVKASFFK